MKESVICSKFGILMVFMKEKMHPERGKQNKKKPTTHCGKKFEFHRKNQISRRRKSISVQCDRPKVHH